MLRIKKKIYILIVLLNCMLTGLHAQKGLLINEKTGIQTPYILIEISKLTFGNGNLTINKKDSTTINYAFSSFRSLSFKTLKSVPEHTNKITKLSIYPNPVTDQLNIEYISTCTGEKLLQIIDMKGETVYSQLLNSLVGINHNTIPLTCLPKGTYICKLHDELKSETTLLIKN